MAQFGTGFLRLKYVLNCLGLGVAVMFGDHRAGAQQDISQRVSNPIIPQPASSLPPERAAIPDVPCKESTPAGDSMAHQGHPISLSISPSIVGRIAFYYGLNLFVLAPRGWMCDASQGADGSYLIVAPPGGHGLFGPTVYIQSWPSEPNGWAMIAAYGGTYFPAIVTSKDVDAAVSQLKQQGNNTITSRFLAPKYQGDHLTYLSDSVLKYWTPPREMGLGVAIGNGLPSDFPPDLSKSSFSLPTYGAIALVNAPEAGNRFINFLAVRLPPEFFALRQIIQDFTARCQPFDQNATCIHQIDFVTTKANN